MVRSFSALALIGAALLLAYGCGAAATDTPSAVGGASGAGGGDASLGGASGAGTGGASGASTGGASGASTGGAAGAGGGADHCTGPDAAGCQCSQGSAPRACYPASADPATRNVGDCKDGTQPCTGTPEFPVWGNCTGAVTPVQESCANGQDDDCNGLQDCADPACATYPGCSGACQNGETRPCYDGPPGTMGVGTCHAGTQTCVNQSWPTTCDGEVTPVKEVCSDALDHDCNHFPGCLDLFACVLDPACQPQCKTDPGCVCPEGSGESTTCPNGMVGISKGSSPLNPGTVECCPCTANDCGNPGCCAETVCKGNSQCSGFLCGPLPAQCNGKVGFDCDDFPEDCDVLCCKCTQCPP